MRLYVLLSRLIVIYSMVYRSVHFQYFMETVDGARKGPRLRLALHDAPADVAHTGLGQRAVHLVLLRHLADVGPPVAAQP
jgi:hypothetical protein